MEELGELEEISLGTTAAHAQLDVDDAALSTLSGSDIRQAIPICEQYDLLSLLGQGGMGNVYRAKNKELGTDVAIKVIHPSLVADPAAVKRFEQEAKAASCLTHANLVAVYDYGKTSVGTPFLVMDLLDGISLGEVIKNEGFLDVNRALDIFIQICDALTHAHCKGVVHRDLKPSNILLTKSESGIELVKIIDFGIAKLLAKTESSITQTGDVFGSPAYMSPEQCLGLETDARSDIYSLGCIIYECLTGHLPFTGSNPIQTIVQHINEQPELFGSDCNDLSIPDTLQALIWNTLEKDANKRYQTMEELRNDLQRIKDGAAPLRVRAVDKKAQKKKKNRVKTAIGILAVLLSALAAAKIGMESGTHQAGAFAPGDPRASPIVPPPLLHLPPIELRDIHNRVLFRSSESHDISEAINEALRKEVNLSHANFSGLTLKNLQAQPYARIDRLAGADFSGSTLIGAYFLNTDLHDAKFTNTALENCTFFNSNLMGADFRKAHRQSMDNEANITFPGSNVRNADFSEANLPDCWFSEKMSGVKFKHANLTKAHFLFNNLSGADFTGATLRGVHFDGAILTGAKFRGADLTGAALVTSVGGDFKGAINANKDAM